MGKWTKLVDNLDKATPPSRLDGYSSGEDEELRDVFYDDNGVLQGKLPKGARSNSHELRRELFRPLISYQFEPESKEEKELGLEGFFIRTNAHGMILYVKYTNPNFAKKDADFLMANSNNAVLYNESVDYDRAREYKLGDRLPESSIIRGSKLHPTCGTNGYCIHTSEEFTDTVYTLTTLGRAPAELAERMKVFMAAVDQSENEDSSDYSDQDDQKFSPQEMLRQLGKEDKKLTHQQIKHLGDQVDGLRSQVQNLTIKIDHLANKGSQEQVNPRLSPSGRHSPKLFRDGPDGNGHSVNSQDRQQSHSFK